MALSMSFGEWVQTTAFMLANRDGDPVRAGRLPGWNIASRLFLLCLHGGVLQEML